MKICDFTVPELEFCKMFCNFTPEERILFDYRSKGIPLEQCAELMNVSVGTVKRISGRVNNKIMRVR